MELSKAVRTGYFSALDGNVFIEGSAVKLFDTYATPQDETEYPYIILSTQVDNQRQQKHCKIYSASILLDIVTASRHTFGREQAEDISEQIENIINPLGQNLDITANGYTIGDTIRGEAFEFNDRSSVFYIYRKLIRYNHLISKN